MESGALLGNLIALARQQHSSILRWLSRFGAAGLFFVSVIDSSIVPLPIPGSTDLLLILLVARRGNAYWMAIAAIAGSIAGGYSTWGTGQKGGEAALKRHLSGWHAERINRWVHKRGAIAVVVSGLLPPPIPHMPFVLAAGAMGMPRSQFLVSYTISRTVRYGLITWLGVRYGRSLTAAWSGYLAQWGPIILWSFVSLIGCGAIYGIWQYRRSRNSGSKPESSR